MTRDATLLKIKISLGGYRRKSRL